MKPRNVALRGVLVAAILFAGRGPAHANEIADVMERFGASVVPVRYTLRPREAPEGGEGQKVEKVICGVIVSDDGLIVISGDPFPDPGGDPRATFDPVGFVVLERDEVERPATALGLNRDLNLAYLKLDDGVPPGRRPVEFQGDAEVRIGQEVLVLGLLPSRYHYAPTFWTGRVSALIDEPRTMYGLTTYIQDLSIGGLAVTPAGTPLGLIAEDVLSRAAELPSNPLSLLGSISQGPKVGYPMIFPPSLFRDDLTEPPELEPEPTRSWFGITMQPLSRPLGNYWKIDNAGGIIISSVLDGSPAEGAGLVAGDIILGIDGEPVTARTQADLAGFRQQVEKLTRGEEVALAVWRAGDVRDLGIRPGVRPRTGFTAREFEDHKFGITVREITIDVIQAQNLPPDIRGVVVARLENAGWSQVSGLKPGDLILRVEEYHVEGLEGFQLALDTARQAALPQVYFFVQRGIETLFVTVRTDW